MTDEVRDSYDAMAELYTKLAIGEIGRRPIDRDWLTAFAELAASSDGAVADLGCGPGHVVNHLSELGLTAIGYDFSPGLIAAARREFPDAQFRVGDLAALDIADSSLMRVLEPGAPVLVSFFAAPSAEAHGTPFDHAVVTAYALFPATIASQLQVAGFTDVEVAVRNPFDGERALEHGTVLAQKPSA